MRERHQEKHPARIAAINVQSKALPSAAKLLPLIKLYAVIHYSCRYCQPEILLRGHVKRRINICSLK